MTKKLVWRLKEQPTSAMLQELVKSSLLTKDEAREILFNETEEGARDVKSLESEIKFLRELVEKLSSGNTTRIIETIRTVGVPYNPYPWYQPYQIWCGASGVAGGGVISGSGITGGFTMNTAQGNGGTMTLANQGNGSFSAIKTF